MRYIGGKFRQSKIIAEYVRRVLPVNAQGAYVEPFCGALGSACAVAHHTMLLSDVSEPLINMWKALVHKKVQLPRVITEEDYKQISGIRNAKDWMTAYAGFGMSFGGKFFRGYARNHRVGKYTKQQCVASTERLNRSVMKKLKYLENSRIIFKCASYERLHVPNDAVVYCDPPYYDRVKGHNFDSFNHADFWNWCRAMIARNTIVLVTEFNVPDDFTILHNWGDTVVRHHASNGNDGTNEILVCHRSQRNLFGGV